MKLIISVILILSTNIERFSCGNEDLVRPKRQMPPTNVPANTNSSNAPMPGPELNIVECSNGTFACRNGNCVEQRRVCDFHNDCGDRSDERECARHSSTCWAWQLQCASTGRCYPGYFQCGNGKCIDIVLACNRRDNCGDRSDEQREVPGLKCIYGSNTDVCVLPQRYVNDSRVHCSDEADECYDARGKFKCFQCFDKRLLISNTQVCDGVFDCFDLSDECLCEERLIPNICDNFCLGEEDGCMKGTFKCGASLGFTARVSDICNRVVECPDGVDEQYCRKQASAKVITCPGNTNNDTTLIAYVCDGRPECFDLSDECGAGCENEQPFCILQNRFTSSSDLTIECDESRYRLSQVDICDGIWSPCLPRVEEEESNCTARFYCSIGGARFISIDKALQCNGYNDCADGSDELDCDRFYCTTGSRPVSVPSSFTFDDFQDCDDGSDECPPSLDNNSFSSRNEMISHVVLRVWLWLMAAIAIVGNSYVIGKTLRKLKKIRKLTAVGKTNHFLIFNLALADSLMGIYLVVLAGYSVHFSGKYCYEDESWRTGNTCTVLGVLSVVASEASVYILTVLTAVRLYSVFKPIASLDMKMRYVFLATLLAWGAAITLAVIPLSPILSDVIIDGAWLPSKFFVSTTVDITNAIRFSNDVGVFTPNITTLSNSRRTIFPWNQIRDYLEQNSPSHRIYGFFSYYSSNSVCVSKLFVTTQQRGWEFSISIISINVILFFFVACAYFAIYKLSTTGMRTQGADERAARMQHKIIKLVATDFACWIPICIMAFIHFSEVANLEGTAYVVTAVVLLPINSVLNPLLYSNAFENAWKKSKPLRSWIFRIGCQCRNKDSENKEGASEGITDLDLRTITNLNEAKDTCSTLDSTENTKNEQV